MTASRAAIRRGLYAITPDEPDTATLCDRVAAVLANGAVLLQYRNKVAGAALRERQAEALAALCLEHGVPLVINDDLELAARLGVGVHLGRDDVAPAQARALLGEGAIIGASCYGDLALATAAAASGASYVAFGSAFPSATKPGAAPLAHSVLADARRALSVPICAIGGIRKDRAPALLALGVDLLAVIGDLFDADDPGGAAREYAALFAALSGATLHRA
jgi:thiamine-phosphate pyrophosphorylase